MNDRNQRGGGRTQSSSTQGSRSRPWNLFLIREYTTNDGKEGSDFIRCGVAFKGEKGFTIEPYVDIRRGDRLQILPPQDNDQR